MLSKFSSRFCNRQLFSSCLASSSILRCVQKPRLQKFSLSVTKWRRFNKSSLQGTFEQSEMTFLKDRTQLRPASDLWKAFGFTVLSGSLAYLLASISEYDKVKSRAQRIFQDWPSFEDLFKKQKQMVHRSNDIKEYFQSLSPGNLNATKIIATCALVTLAWKIPALQPKMWQYFSNGFASRSLCLPMFLSVLSHKHVLHLGVNMYVLYSFAGAVTDKFLGVDQFNALFFTGGVVASLTSLMHKCAIRTPIRALGASGAICTLLVYACSKMPEARLSIIFLPFLNFPAEFAVYGIIALDVIGLFLGWRIFDHAAHIGGSLFGLFYAHWGEEFYCERVRPYLFKKYTRLGA